MFNQIVQLACVYHFIYICSFVILVLMLCGRYHILPDIFCRFSFIQVILDLSHCSSNIGKQLKIYSLYTVPIIKCLSHHTLRMVMYICNVLLKSNLKISKSFMPINVCHFLYCFVMLPFIYRINNF